MNIQNDWLFAVCLDYVLYQKQTNTEVVMVGYEHCYSMNKKWLLASLFKIHCQRIWTASDRMEIWIQNEWIINEEDVIYESVHLSCLAGEQSFDALMLCLLM